MPDKGDELATALRRAGEAIKQADSALDELAKVPATKGDLTVAQLAAREGVSEPALLAFARALGETGVREPSAAAVERAAVLAAADHAWEGELGPLLETAQVATLLRGVSRQRVSELARGHRLIVLRDSAGRLRFPAFQFHDGRAMPALVVAFWALAERAESAWTAASWCVAPDEALDGLTPVQWARDGRDAQQLLTVARHDAARLSA